MAASYMHCNTHIFWHADLSCSYIPPKRNRALARREGIRNGLQVPEREVKRVDSRNMRDEDEEEILDDERPRSAHQKTTTPADQVTQPLKSLKSAKSMEPLRSEALKMIPPARSYLPVTVKSDLKATPVQILKFILSDAALPLCRPDDEIEDVDTRGKQITTYAQLLTPFEELVCAVIVSRSIPHGLSLRIIRTILNAPYNFRNPVAIKSAGPKKIREALGVALAQDKDKDKVAEELELLIEALAENNWHNDLSNLRRSSKTVVESEREVLRRSVKGLGRSGLDTFYRRSQWQWDETYPFVDIRTQTTLERLGLPKRAEGLAKMIEIRWRDLKFESSRNDFTVEQKRRRAFVILLERLVSAELEKKMSYVLEEASKL